MPFIGRRVATGRLDPVNPLGAGFWTVTFQPGDFRIHQKFLIKHISLKGPAGSSLQVWIDTTFFDNTPNGDLNSWDPAQPMPIIPGQTVYFYWSTASATTVPTVTLDCYTDELF